MIRHLYKRHLSLKAFSKASTLEFGNSARHQAKLQVVYVGRADQTTPAMPNQAEIQSSDVYCQAPRLGTLIVDDDGR